MNPPTEQLIRDYLNRLAVAARSELAPAARQALLNQTRARIEAGCDPGHPTAVQVRKVLADLGDPVALVEAASARSGARDAVLAGTAGGLLDRPPVGFLDAPVPADDTADHRHWPPAPRRPADADPGRSGSGRSGAGGSGVGGSGVGGSGAGGSGAGGSGAGGSGAGDSGAGRSETGGTGPDGIGPGLGGADADGEVVAHAANPAEGGNDMGGVGDCGIEPVDPMGSAVGGPDSGAVAVPGAARAARLLAAPVGRRAAARATSGLRPSLRKAAGPATAGASRAAGLGRSLISLARRHKLETAALLLLAAGGILFPPIWIAGALLATASRVWDIRDKWLGLALPVLLTVVGTVLIMVLGGRRGNMTSYVMEAWVAAGRLSRLLAVAGAAYLAWRLHRGRRAPRQPPWKVPKRLDL